MCGITGVIDKRIGDKQDAVKRMTDCIAHRGPDDDGFLSDEHVGLGMRRLSIIDIEGGSQPIYSSDGRYAIFFNGEIYNYKELKPELHGYEWKTGSDTEVILAGYLKWGAGVLGRLRGMFAFSIYDTAEKKIFLARDFFGIKPVYYLNSAGPVNSHSLTHSVGSDAADNLRSPASLAAFSSEIKSFLKLPGFKPEVNDAAVYNYLSFQYNPLDETFFKNVFKLPPAHYMSIDAETGSYEVKRYWEFKFKPDDSLGEEETKKKIKGTLEDSVAHHLIADVPVGSFLSGGIDSSIIATLMQKLRGDRKIKTFTVGFQTLSEGVEARETAEPLGTDHTEISVSAEEYFAALPKAVWHFDEPVADPSALGLYFLAREARKHVTVVLSGEGADELFGGYNIYLEPYARRKIAWLPRVLLKLLTKVPLRGRHYAERAATKLEDWYIGNASIFKGREVEALWREKKQETFSLTNIYAGVSGRSESTKMQYVDLNTWLVGDILAKADKMTMAHSLELRVPFLDKKVAELAETLPDKFKWRGGVTKYLLREAFKNVLPESTRNRKKLGFPTPVKNWFTKDRQDLYDLILENAYIKEHVDMSYVSKMIEDHVGGKADNARKIYLLLMLAIWYNTFIKQA
jgi:asparagine synthase (glutamine-hydrolysing)